MSEHDPSADATHFAATRADQNRARLTQALVRAGAGDRTAFAEVYRATSAKLFGVCLRIFADRTEAEDALQDAYITIWNKAATFVPGRASPISWLVTLTRNRAIDRFRARGKMAFAALDDASEVADDAPLAEAGLIEAGEYKALGLCIETLEPRDIGFIRAAFVGGATYAELAARENSPLGTVKSRIRRALLSLRACLEANA